MADQAESSSSRAPQEASQTSSDSQQEESTTETCAKCLTPETNTDPDPETPNLLKPCTKCHTTKYCSRDCTKADFKQHKKVCAKLAQAYAESGAYKAPVRSRAPPKEGFRGGLQKWQFDT
ncbi:unnamed protein product [Zymoseptoria tritici ST99CH_1A5]|uniref:MYND-type domain-containing protein n=1 Tax=Zymoseptoria tritici ST99CH_1A5 TaxID=1276529 RepID=A0A1Y6LGZ7_ZYMTR|nr:unnamed protein product [Zymoseptoria tritici ST99CH_3D1]SMY22690.1 unnamed protein product [Zymoseptoria tritici ST99CH_1A5]